MGEAKCYECKKELDEEYYCFGCKEYICDDETCGGKIPWTMASQMGHGHDVGMHFVAAEGYNDYGEKVD